MTAKELERLLVASGVNGSKADAITRKLREAGHLPKGGRGPNAPQIGPREAALFLIAVAGSSKGNDADTRLEKLLELPSRASRFLPDAVEEILREPDQLAVLAELRVSRTGRYAAIHSNLGEIEEFIHGERETRATRFSVEGIIPRRLLNQVAARLASSANKDAIA